MSSKKIAGIVMIAAGLVVGWFGVSNGQVDKAVLGLAGALLVSGAYAGWGPESNKKV